MNEIKKTTLHPDNQPNTDIYPKTSTDQIEGLNNIITGINNEIEKKVNTVDNFVRIFTIPYGVDRGTLTADVKEKLCNPDGHNYYVYDVISQMILKYSFNANDETIEYKAIYFRNNMGYEITMQIFLSNGSWIRSQAFLKVPTNIDRTLYLHKVVFEDTLSSGAPVQYGGVHIEFMFLSPSEIEFSIYDFFGIDKYPDTKSPYFNIICYKGDDEGNITYGYNWIVYSADTQEYGIFFYKTDTTNSGLISDGNPTQMSIDGSQVVIDTVTEL